ncbi:MerR family DNA-binding transcriptional regulator [Actinophytocola sp.]|uniref:MerR family DNA-binding transcriptional regulator n=1 Tax=Actinophytocola sp. TaxID=1872138 RepID=UPI0039C85B2F
MLTSDGRTLAQGALGWLWAVGDNTVPIPGFKGMRQAERMPERWRSVHSHRTSWHRSTPCSTTKRRTDTMTVAPAAGYTIREAAGRIGLTQDTVRYYERIGLVPPVARDRSGYRR